MSSKLGLAILGAGIFAREGRLPLDTILTVEHLPAIEKSGLYDVKAVYSRSKKSAEALIPNGSVDIYSDDSGPGKSVDDLLAREDIQAVDIALPITHQPNIIRKALGAGKHVVLTPSRSRF
jgi:glucose-fructose oxidoreductase